MMLLIDDLQSYGIPSVQNRIRLTSEVQFFVCRRIDAIDFLKTSDEMALICKAALERDFGQ